MFNQKDMKQVFSHIIKRDHPKLLIDGGEIKRFPGLIDKKKIIMEADLIFEHVFDLLGSGKKKLGKKINWHCDFKSGYCWNPKKYYLDFKYGDVKGIDVKVPWELSRFQNWVLLGQAYSLTKNEKYCKEFMNQIEDWILNNPVRYGVNWASTMDSAIRASNWVVSFNYFRDSKLISEDFTKKLINSLLVHGKFIETNLENLNGVTTNHYLSNIAGLLFLGIFFSETKQGQKWIKFGIKQLKLEMERQVLDDGCDYEYSTYYHCLVLEFFFYSTLVVVQNESGFNGKNFSTIAGRIFGEKYVKKLHKMFEALLFILKPNGRIPQIGDNDSGKFFKLSNMEDVLDMRYLLCFGSIFFNESKFRIKEFGFSEAAFWLYGLKGYKIWKKMPSNPVMNIKNKKFSNAGWYIFRKGLDYCIFVCGQKKNDVNGHSHNDKLSFELMIDGKDIFVDPGTYVYTPYPDWRNTFRSTRMHNTLMINSQEQNPFNGLFSILNKSKVKVLRVNQHSVSAVHHDSSLINHKRSIFFNEKCVEIKDSVGKRPQNLEWNFHLAPNIIPKKIAPNKVRLNNHVVFESELPVIVMQSLYSKAYGYKEKSYCLKMEDRDGKCDFKFTIFKKK